MCILNVTTQLFLVLPTRSAGSEKLPQGLTSENRIQMWLLQEQSVAYCDLPPGCTDVHFLEAHLDSSHIYNCGIGAK